MASCQASDDRATSLFIWHAPRVYFDRVCGAASRPAGGIHEPDKRKEHNPMKLLVRSNTIIFASLLAPFTVSSYAITDSGLDHGPEHRARVLQTTIGTVSGPFIGAISRGFQGCCLSFSLSIVTFCAPALLLGVAAQFIPMPERRWTHATKVTLWAGAWLLWFGGGILSFAHALS